MANDAFLVHTCCAPCLCALLGQLKQRSGGFVAYFSNPNVHPLIEFRRRLKACHVLAGQQGFALVADEAYGLEPFLDAIGPQRARPARCRVCYAMRLDATARHAADHGFPIFTSTLLVSPQQNRDAICELGHQAAERVGVAFDDTDYRALHHLGVGRARSQQLYRQQYCGCIFSEAERYRDTTRHLYRPQRKSQAPNDK